MFGVHSVAFYNRCTKVPYGIVKVLKGGSLSLSGETIELTGGSSKYAWDVQDGLITAEMAMTFAEYPDFLFEVLLGKPVTTIAAEANGSVNGFVNIEGSSIKSGTNGISAVAVTSGDHAYLKAGKYVIVAKSADTFDVYAMSDVDFARGTNAVYLDDSLKIIDDGDVSAASHISADFGLTFTKVGTPAFVAGDTAYFEVLPVHSGAREVIVGGVSDVYPDFGCVVYAQKKSGQLYEFDMFRCKALGMPFNFGPNEFSESEVTMKAYYDPARNGVFSHRLILA